METPSQSVTLSISCTGNPTEYMASESSSFSSATWQYYSLSPSFTLSTGNTLKTIYLKVKNNAGESAAVYAQINLTQPPTWTKLFRYQCPGSASDPDNVHVVIQTADGGYAVTAGIGVGDTRVNMGLMKVDEDGEREWSKMYDVMGPSPVVQTADGGFALAGTVPWHDENGNYHCNPCLVKTDAEGNQEWARTYTIANFINGTLLIRTADGGFALAGDAHIYGKTTNVCLVKTDADGNQEWANMFDQGDFDHASSLIQAADSGFVVAGESSNQYTSTHLYLLKSDAHGTQEWAKTYGGGGIYDYGGFVVQSADGGFALAGTTHWELDTNYDYDDWRSNIYLVKTNLHGEQEWIRVYKDDQGGDFCSSLALLWTADGGFVLGGSSGFIEPYVIKTDSNGEREWARIYLESDPLSAMAQTADGGFALGGASGKLGCLLKTDAGGVQEWARTYGGVYRDQAYSVMQTSDGEYAVAGTNYDANVACLTKTDAWGNSLWTQSYSDFKTIGLLGVPEVCAIKTADGGYALAGCSSDSLTFYLMKTDAYGVREWGKTCSFLSSFFELHELSAVIQTSDGGYALVGYQGLRADKNMYLVKTNANGNPEWAKTYGGIDFACGSSVVQTADGGYAVVGDSGSYEAGGYDMYLVKTDAYGNQEWAKTYGGSNHDYARCVVQTADGGYVLAGQTYSYAVGGLTDLYLVKTDSEGNQEWQRTYGGEHHDGASSLVLTADGGFAIAGDIYENGSIADVYLLKTNADGHQEWTRNYGGDHDEFGYSMIQTLDGGYALAGSTTSFDADGVDMFVVKTDAGGNAPAEPVE